MFGRAVRRVVRRSVPEPGQLDTVEVDETGVDVVEALAIVSGSRETKDPTEEEISSSGDISLGDNHEEKVAERGLTENAKTISRNLSKPVWRIPARSRRVHQINSTNKRAVVRGKCRAARWLGNVSNSFRLPRVKINDPIKNQIEIDLELAEEYSLQGRSKPSLEQYLYRDQEDGHKLKVVFQCDFYSPDQSSSWSPSKITTNLEERVLHISSKSNIAIDIEQLGSVKVEGERRVVWLDQFGVLLNTDEDTQRFALLLDFSWRGATKRKSLHLFLPSREHPRTQSVLLTTTVEWRPANGSFLQFIGKYFYHLKTPHKQVQSLEEAEFFVKAGCLYIYELSSSLLPCCSLSLSGCSVTSLDQNLTILTSSSCSLTISCQSEGTLAWLEEVCGKTRDWMEADSVTGADDGDDDNAKVQTRGQLVVSREELGWEGDSGQTWSINLEHLLHLAVDKKNKNIQMAWLDTGQDGLTTFRTEADLELFLNTFRTEEKTRNVAIMEINSRLSFA